MRPAAAHGKYMGERAAYLETLVASTLDLEEYNRRQRSAGRRRGLAEGWDKRGGGNGEQIQIIKIRAILAVMERQALDFPTVLACEQELGLTRTVVVYSR